MTSTDSRRPAWAGILYSAIVGFLSLASGVILLPVVATYVGSGPYGVWLFLVTITTYLGYGDLGIYSSIVHFGARARAGDGEYSPAVLLGAGLAWSALVALVAIPIFGILAWQYSSPSLGHVDLSVQSRTALVVAGSVLIMLTATRPFNGALVAAGYYVTERRAALVALLFRVLGTLFAAIVLKSLVAVVVVESVATAIPQVIAAIVVLRRVGSPEFRGGLIGPLRKMLGYSAKSLLTGVPWAVVMSGGTVILGLAQGPSSVTFFNMAYRVANGFRQLIHWVLEPFRAAMSREALKDLQVHGRITRSLTFVILTLVGCAAGFLSITADWIMHSWLGARMPTGEIAITVIILMFGLWVESLQVPLTLAGDTAGYPGVFIAPQVIWAVLFVPLGIWWAHYWGIIGVAAAMEAPLVVTTPLYVWVARRALQIDVGAWWREGVAPSLWLALPPLVVSGGLMVFKGQLVWEVPVVYVFVFVGMFALLRKRLPLAQLVQVLKVRM